MRFEYFKNEKTDTLYVRVNKKIARTAFNCGSCVIITPVNANPNFWHCTHETMSRTISRGYSLILPLERKPRNTEIKEG